jgi:hypothetical protein
MEIFDQYADRANTRRGFVYVALNVTGQIIFHQPYLEDINVANLRLTKSELLTRTKDLLIAEYTIILPTLLFFL